MKKEDYLNKFTRAEDIVLGALGLSESSRVLSLDRTDSGYRGIAEWDDGEQFEFESDDELSELESWAVDVLTTEFAQAARRRA